MMFIRKQRVFLLLTFTVCIGVIIIINTKHMNVSLKTEIQQNKFIRYVNNSTKTRYGHNETYYVCAGTTGRLGNQLYVFASSYGIAKRSGMKLIVGLKPDNLSDTFQIEGAFETDWGLCEAAKLVHTLKCCQVANHAYKIHLNSTVYVYGYLQSYKYFTEYNEEIRQYLTFKDQILRTAKTKLNTLLTKKYGKNHRNRTLIGIHVRRGDYLLKVKQEYGYKVPSEDYFYKAQQYMQNRYKNITYLACSNDLTWTQNAFRSQRDVIVVPTGPAAVDLALLSLLDHMITSVGSYSFWAAWFINGTTVYYKNFTLPNSSFASEFDKDKLDTIPPHWIGF
ncbi:galactoside alpha-(1,2)-fucosyltransferase 1 [Patella vulgata]|uniref:galactoside alpha-(1,2)-fucosyltransferase 1 n=1 Tax=Patella vulgata TaxID=6465 RepID=UPI00217FB438|nr:galactoside alpha-(1,2)-fucosyltransferase 1 [Patella vulgata]